jgi:ABC-2 type transport system permease protein
VSEERETGGEATSVNAATDRGTWRLVARRDFWVRLRERSFLVSTLINVAVISILVLARASNVATSGPSYDLGYVGSAAIAQGTADLADDAGVTVRLHELPDEAAANAALRDGSVDAVVIGDQLRGLEGVPDPLISLVQGSARDAAVMALLAEHQVPQSELDAARATSLKLTALEAAPRDRDQNAAIAFVGVLLLYGQLFGYGIWVASGVIEEKASRVVEMLLSAIRARQLLLGKIVGIGVLGLAQLVFIASFAIGLALLTGALKDVGATALGAVGLVIGWFILGFAFYATLFAAAGSLVTRMEELQNVIVPINLTILVSFFISIGALQDPNGRLQVIASLLPTSSALAMPVRIVLGAAPGWQIALSLVLLIGSTILLVPLAARLYSGAVLRTRGRVKIREAWRSAA